jgi:glutamine amidotransferase PdxT
MNFGKEFEEIIIKHTRRFFGARDEAFHVNVVLVSGKTLCKNTNITPKKFIRALWVRGMRRAVRNLSLQRKGKEV